MIQKCSSKFCLYFLFTGTVSRRQTARILHFVKEKNKFVTVSNFVCFENEFQVKKIIKSSILIKTKN